MLPEERPPGLSHPQRGGRHGPGQSACRANTAGAQGGRAHAGAAPLQAATDAAASAGQADELYQAAAGVGHRDLNVPRASHRRPACAIYARERDWRFNCICELCATVYVFSLRGRRDDESCTHAT